MKEPLTRAEIGKYLSALDVEEIKAGEAYAAQMSESTADLGDLVFAYKPEDEAKGLKLAGIFGRLGGVVERTLSKDGAAFD
ncbi:MAG: hypothetical protein IPK01_00605 [Acidobacteria bacterium]|nr:hypothetical protein [Acidobacteriota bacterium]